MNLPKKLNAPEQTKHRKAYETINALIEFLEKWTGLSAETINEVVVKCCEKCNTRQVDNNDYKCNCPCHKESPVSQCCPKCFNRDMSVRNKEVYAHETCFNADCPCHKESPVSQSVEGGVIKQAVDRFLGWKLPADFSPDAGISFKREFNEHTEYPMKHEPIGTNLFTATQATEMVRYMLGDTLSTLVKEMEGKDSPIKLMQDGVSYDFSYGEGFRAGISAAQEVVKKMV